MENGGGDVSELSPAKSRPGGLSRRRAAMGCGRVALRSGCRGAAVAVGYRSCFGSFPALKAARSCFKRRENAATR